MISIGKRNGTYWLDIRTEEGEEASFNLCAPPGERRTILETAIRENAWTIERAAIVIGGLLEGRPFRIVFHRLFTGPAVWECRWHGWDGEERVASAADLDWLVKAVEEAADARAPYLRTAALERRAQLEIDEERNQKGQTYDSSRSERSDSDRNR